MFTTVTNPHSSVPPCVSDPTGWDLEFGSFLTWAGSIAACQRCPLLAACRADLEALPERPIGLIWAGVAFGERRQVLSLSGLQRRSDRRRNRVAVSSTSSPGAAA